MAKKPIKKKTTTNPKSTTSETTSTTKATRTTSKTSAAKKSTSTKKTSATKTSPKKETQSILLRKFDDWRPASLFQVPPSMVTIPSAPPFTNASDDKEIKRIKTLLLQTHSPDDFILSPEKKAAQEARFTAHEEARMKAEEEAKKKAEEEARIKAEKKQKRKPKKKRA
ncbi:hypothetical protein OOT00_14465 [Desulfobotulus sp. H1]|uniref:Uncharacterized protein n=1 Tax=Desulfobotulus pelophilus TaxID=2823377 RepID=A0ABT3NCJ7_9BACT|nr:hypothetical protein [Desulfobotulus pelophilus]MCW7755189.1 hypothetical protein [Desulfobotulus pelophilus]